jgi:hypothetical protein
MSESSNVDLESPRRFHCNFMLPVLFRPRRTFEHITALPGNTWATPMLALSVLVLCLVLAGGWAKHKAAAQGEMTLPLNFEYYSPEQQAQFMQATQAQQGAAFTYVLPSLGALVGLWISWLVLGGVLHLVMMLIGGRGELEQR